MKYNKWKDYSRYSTIKRIIKAYDSYEKRPIKFIANESKFPGKIINENLLIRNKVKKDGRNILVSKSNDVLDTKLDYKNDIKFLSKERFDLLNNYFKCDFILKSNIIIENENKNYDIYSAHLKLIFLPTLNNFKNYDNKNIEDFKKSKNVIYDIYLKQSDTKNEFLKEISNILKEKPYLLKNMGVKLNRENDVNEITNHIKNLKFYIPTGNNMKTIKEMTDFIFSDETIEKIKSGEKITDNDLEVVEVEYVFTINNLFHLNCIQAKNNVDEIARGIFFIEYIPPDKFQNLSIFEIKSNTNIVMANEEIENKKKKIKINHLIIQENLIANLQIHII